jgi:hypothetical protein
MSHDTDSSLAHQHPTMPLHCIVIGHNDVHFATFSDKQKQFADRSAGYNEIVTNSVCTDGHRRTYMDLLNLVLERANGAPHDLNTFRVPSLAVAYLVNYLRQRGLNAEGVNFFNTGRNRIAQLLRCNPVCVAITTTYYVDDDPIREIVLFVRQLNRDTRIIVGGPRIFSLSRSQPERIQALAFKSIGADIYVESSQGESTLGRVVQTLADCGDLSRVPNLTFSAPHGTFVRTLRETEDNDLQENTIDWTSFPPTSFTPINYMRTGRTLLSVTGRTDETARRHFHPGDKDGDRADHLLYRRSRHRQHEGHEEGRPRRPEGDCVFRDRDDARLGRWTLRRQSVATRSRHERRCQHDRRQVDPAVYGAGARAQSALDYVTHIIPATVIGAFAEGEILQVLFFSLLFAFALSFLGEPGKPLLRIIDLVSHTLFGVVAIIMRAAPIGAFGAMAFTIGKYGIGTLLSLGQLMASVYATCLIFIFIILGVSRGFAGSALSSSYGTSRVLPAPEPLAP